MSEDFVYKIVNRSEWEDANTKGAYGGSADDRRDGFIHLSTSAQLTGTLAKHFKGLDNLMLVRFDSGTLGEKLVWEPSRGGALFPHYYGVIDPALAVGTLPLQRSVDGTHTLPPGLA